MTWMIRSMALAVTLFVLVAGGLMAAGTVIDPHPALAEDDNDDPISRFYTLLMDVNSISLEDKSTNKTVKIEQNPPGNVSLMITEASKDAQGIAISVTKTKDGKEVTKEYKAKDAKELEKKHPEAYKIYQTITEVVKAIKKMQSGDGDGADGDGGAVG